MNHVILRTVLIDTLQGTHELKYMENSSTKMAYLWRLPKIYNCKYWTSMLQLHFNDLNKNLSIYKEDGEIGEV